MSGIQVVLTGVVFGRPGSIIELSADEAETLVDADEAVYYTTSKPEAPAPVEVLPEAAPEPEAKKVKP